MKTYDTLIIGAGLSGLTVAQTLRVRCYGHKFLVLDRADRPGGVIRTDAKDGFTAEAGPHGFLDNCSETRTLVADLGLEGECVKAPLSHFVRYLYTGGRLQQVPQTPKAILATRLLPWKDKIRVLGDLFKKPLDGDPSVADWVANRFGSALLPFVDAALTGTYAGDLTKLSIDGVMPGVRMLEKRHGSVIRGLLAAGKQKKSPGRMRMPAMTSFRGGMQRLPERMAQFLTEGADLLLNCEVKKIRKVENRWHAETGDGSFEAENLVLALPVNVSLSLLKDIDGGMPLPLLPEAWIATVVLAFDKEVVLPPGFGYLIPDREGCFTLGTLFSSNMFPGRSPAGHPLIEVLVGGRRHPERAEFDDGTLIRQAREDVKTILNISGEPIHARVLRNSGGIPQPEKGYSGLLAWRDRLMNNQQGLFICGFGWEGIGINDMVKAAVRVAEKIMHGNRQEEGGPGVKGVYF